MRSCRRDQVRNPASGRCVLRSGRIGLRLKSKKKTPARKKTPKKTPAKKTPAKKKSYISGVSDAELKAYGLGPGSWYKNSKKK